MQETCYLQERMKELAIKSTQKIFSKLVSHYMSHKISKEEFISKLDKFKEKVQETQKTIEKMEKIIKEREGADSLDFAILEHLSLNECTKTASLYRNTFLKKSEQHLFQENSDFYAQIKKFVNEIENGICKNALSFCKQYKSHFKEEFNSLEVKMALVEFIDLAQKDRLLAMEYARKNFQNGINALRDHLGNLIDEKNSDVFRESNETIVSGARDLFYKSVYGLFRVDDKLEKWLSYGLVAYTTQNCGSNLKCPGCAYGKYSVMVNRTENSLILCEGEDSVLDESNMAYTDDRGKVFGKKYLVKSKKQLKEPRICYFV